MKPQQQPRSGLPPLHTIIVGDAHALTLVAALEALGLRAEATPVRLVGALKKRAESAWCLVVESGLVPSALDEPSVRDLKRDVGAGLLVAWHHAGEEADVIPPWADAAAGDINVFFALLAGHAVESARQAAGELDQARSAVEASRQAAHDLIQPLTTIVARSHLLLEVIDPGDPKYRALEIITQESSRLAQAAERFRGLLPFRRGA